MLGRATGNTDTQDSPRPRLGGSHHLPPYSILYASPRGVHPNGFSLPGLPHGSPEILPTGTPGTLKPHNLRADLGSKCGLKQSCSSRWELSNGMWHVVYSQVNRVDSQLLVVGSQIANLTPGLSFAHNLCFRCLNESCKPILDIYTSIAFQWYKELLEAKSFDPCNRALKIWESFRDSNSQHGSSLGSVRVHSLTLFALPRACGVLPGLPLGPQPCNPLLWSRAQG